MDELIHNLKIMLVSTKLFTYKKLDKMPDIAIQEQFHEHFEILETTSVFKNKEIYYISKSDLKALLVKSKVFREVVKVIKKHPEKYNFIDEEILLNNNIKIQNIVGGN